VTVTLNDAKPTGDRTNFAAVEVLANAPAASAIPPTVTLVNPTGREVLSSVVPLAAQVTASAPVRAVTFRIDGHRLHAPVTAAPFATRWNTAATADGTHVVTVRVVDDNGRVGTARRVVVVRNPAPPMTCFVVQRDVTAFGRGTVATRPLRTAVAGERLLAMVSADGPAGQRVQVHGAGLTWRLLERANRRAGDAEVWEAVVPEVTGGIRVQATPKVGGYRQSVTVVALEGVSDAGSVAARSGRGNMAKIRLPIVGSTPSLVFAVGISHGKHAVAEPKLPVGQVLAGHGRSFDPLFWSQYTNDAIASDISFITMKAKAPGSWTFVAVQAIGDSS
jgi:hypothetical protein